MMMMIKSHLVVLAYNHLFIHRHQVIIILINIRILEIFTGFEFQVPEPPLGLCWQPGDVQGQYILVSDDDSEWPTHVTWCGAMLDSLRPYDQCWTACDRPPTICWAVLNGRWPFEQCWTACDRTQTAVVIAGGGGCGKTKVITKLLIPLLRIGSDAEQSAFFEK